MGLTALLIAAVLWLAWSNGANDNFKGVATLYGSRTTTFRGALIWASAATLFGSLLSVMLAHTLVARFSGSGLIAEHLLTPALLGAVAAAGAVTIFLATRIGMPTSTTHALTGALVGAALVANWDGVNWALLANKFAQPLLLSPVLAVGLTAALYPPLSWYRRRTGVEQQTCLCIGEQAPQPVTLTAAGGAMLIETPGQPVVAMEDASACVERYRGRFVGVQAQTLVDAMHYLSGAAVCFARAVNDTPKIAALLLAGTAMGGSALGSGGVLLMVAVAMTAGGLLHAQRVAETMSRRITDLNPGQGLT
ncbi:MAG: anion permease, partial [Phycisphaeraceae bacterium]